ncbi:MAG: hypothetical protein MO852_15250, partial [Candidatus Devosia euplotis]|nr:hypothetical protein [Candidatus Devosia euplotis]
MAPQSSPIAGSTLLLIEGRDDGAGNHSGWLIGQNDKGATSYFASPGVYTTDCVSITIGELCVLALVGQL